MIRQLLQSITKREWRVVLVCYVVLVLLTSAPYLYGYITRPEGSVYTGIRNLTPGDFNAWFSWMEQVQQGKLLLKNPYTTEPQKVAYTNPLWESIGLFAKFFSMSNLLAMHVARILLLAVFLIVLMLFLSFFLRSVRQRIITFLVILFSSGIGLFVGPFIRLYHDDTLDYPTDLWVPESNTFLTIYHSPHLLASLIMVLLIFLLMLIAFRTGRWWASVFAGLAGLLLVWFHPFNAATVFAVLFVYLFIHAILEQRIPWRVLLHFAVFGLLTLPAFAYLFWLRAYDSTIALWESQNLLPSPSILMYLAGFGLLVPLALIGGRASLWPQRKEALFILTWVVVSSSLLYSPLDFQRRLVEGLHVPVSILAGWGIVRILDWISYRFIVQPRTVFILGSIVGAFLVVFLPLTNFQILSQDLYTYATKKEFPYYLTGQEASALAWVKDNTPDNAVLLSRMEIGNFLPAYTGRTVYIGHGPQTLYWRDKHAVVTRFFFHNNLDDAKYQFLKQNSITYIYYGEREHSIGTYNPFIKPYLEKVYDAGGIAVFRVL